MKIVSIPKNIKISPGPQNWLKIIPKLIKWHKYLLGFKLTKVSSQRLKLLIYSWQKHYFSPYILESQSIWFIHFGSGQFSLCYFQHAVNLVLTINTLTEMPTWQTAFTCGKVDDDMATKIIIIMSRKHLNLKPPKINFSILFIFKERK